MTEPRTFAGQRFYYGNAIRGFEHKLLRDILAIENEAAELARLAEGQEPEYTFDASCPHCRDHTPHHPERA